MAPGDDCGINTPSVHRRRKNGSPDLKDDRYNDGSPRRIHMRARGLVVVALSAGLLGAACKKTVEGENKAWDRNVQQIASLSATYPSFANALKEQQKRAEDAMTAARSVSDKEAAAKKMAEANDMIGSGFVSMLSGLDGRTRTLRNKLVTAATGAEQGADQMGAKVVSDDAQRILGNIDAALKTGAPDATQAEAILRKLDADLTSASSNVDRVIEAANKRKAEAAKVAAAPAAGTTGAAAAVAPAKVQWKCTYCNHMNDDARSKCENCGAPRPAPGSAKPAPGKPAAPAKKK
jgi:hypothetical protein